MQVKKVLKGKELKSLENLIRKNYGYKFDFSEFTVFLTSEQRVWLIDKGVNLNLLKTLRRCYMLGMYFGKLKRNNKIKLSIEGAMLIGEKAKKNVVTVNEDEAEKFIYGMNVKPQELIDCELHNFVIVKCSDNVLGCGILREGFVENLTPKARTIKL